MKCTSCGSEIMEGEKFCRSCGAPVAEEESKPALPVPAKLKEFVAQYGGEKLRKSINSCWIVLYVCAGITLVAQIAAHTFPFDAILLAAIALWMQLTYSKASAIVAVVFAALEIILTLVLTGNFGGWLILLASVYALVYILKADKAFKAFKENGTLPEI